MNQPKQIQMNVALKDTTAIVCEECGCEVFVEGVMLRKVSKYLSGTTSDSIMPLATFACLKCAHINDSFRPKDV